MRIALAAWLLATAAGCRPETPVERAEREAREEAERKEALEKRAASQPLVAPAPLVLPAGSDRVSLLAKPGHWNAVAQPLTAQNGGFDGVVEQSIADRNGEPTPIGGDRYRLTSGRSVVLAEKATKRVESLVLLPDNGADPTNRPRLVTRATDRKTGRLELDSPTPLRPLLDHQYHFVLLAKEPSRYGYLEATYVVTAGLPALVDPGPLAGGRASLDPGKHYRVVAVEPGKGGDDPPLPDTAHAWSTIAYVLWDEYDPAQLRAAQRDALVDWVRWGGRLVISGPDSLDLARGTFLEPLLPADGGPARRLTAAELQPMERAWLATTRDTFRPLTTEKTAWTGVTLAPRSQAQPVAGAEGLAYERRFGRGSVVVTAFRLSEPGLVNWSRGFENLLNGGLLRRPGRTFAESGDGSARPVAIWTLRPGQTVADAPLLSPAVNTPVRWLVRDALADPRLRAFSESVEEDGVEGGIAPAQREFSRLVPPMDRAGYGAWNDDGVVASRARDTLRRSAGVEPPSAGLVAAMLGGYLLLLVPLNWGFFHALGRVELAWVAAPILAVAAAVFVVQQAQLDIGFVRSQTEIGVLEAQPDGTRALMTRFTALYSSLTTTYELAADDPGAVLAPFARSIEGGRVAQRLLEARYERQEKARLRGLLVPSASTELVRSEETLDLATAVPAGSNRIGGVVVGASPAGVPRLENRTGWRLTSVAVAERPDGVDGPPTLRGCWIGELPPGAVASLSMRPIPWVPAGETEDEGAGREIGAAEAVVSEDVELAPAGDGGDPEDEFAPVPPTDAKRADEPPRSPFEGDRRREAESLADGADRVDLEGLFAVALDPRDFEPGERRAVARIDAVLPGVAVTPEASQRRGATLLVVHLGYGPLPAPERDANAPVDAGGQ